MYKLTILFFILTAFNSQSLINTYQLIFENKEATYMLQVKEGNLIFENQPNVKVKIHGDSASDTEPSSSAQGKIYKITKGASFEEGLKIGEIDIDDIDRIGEIIIEDIDRIGGIDIEDIDRIGEIIIDDIDRIKEDALFKTDDCYAYEIKLGYELVRIIAQSRNSEQKIEIPENGFYIYIVGNELILFE